MKKTEIEREGRQKECCMNVDVRDAKVEEYRNIAKERKRKIDGEWREEEGERGKGRRDIGVGRKARKERTAPDVRT